jgi:uncharacterized protein YuzE
MKRITIIYKNNSTPLVNITNDTDADTLYNLILHTKLSDNPNKIIRVVSNNMMRFIDTNEIIDCMVTNDINKKGDNNEVF